MIGIRQIFVQTSILDTITATYQDIPGLSFVMSPHSAYAINMFLLIGGSGGANGEKTQLLNADSGSALMILEINNTDGLSTVKSFTNTQNRSNFTGAVMYRGKLVNATASPITIKVQGAVQAATGGNASFGTGVLEVVQIQ